MSPLPHRTPSIGSIVKKITEINPELTSAEIAQIIRQSMKIQGGANNDFETAEIIDENKAISLAKASLRTR